MNRFILLIAVSALLATPSPLQSGTEADPAKGVREELKLLSRKVDELKSQNRAILDNQAKILQELQVLKVRVRKS